jgi:hypothetical protein
MQSYAGALLIVAPDCPPAGRDCANELHRGARDPEPRAVAVACAACNTRPQRKPLRQHGQLQLVVWERLKRRRRLLQVQPQPRALQIKSDVIDTNGRARQHLAGGPQQQRGRPRRRGARGVADGAAGCQDPLPRAPAVAAAAAAAGRGSWCLSGDG